MLTVSEAAALLGLSTGRTRRLIATGYLKAEKRGKQWMIFERSVEERMESGAKAGRPRVSESDNFGCGYSDEYCRAYSLYLACSEAFDNGISNELLSSAKSEEEREFYMHVFNFFLTKKCKELVSQGVY